MSLKAEQLLAICPKLGASKAARYAEPLWEAMKEAGITTPQRMAAFLGQIAHESGELRWMEEIWGPTDAQKNYEPPHSVATRLGNDQPGDGYLYRGRGPIQLTGRANYRRAGDALGLPLVDRPWLAAKPDDGFRVAAWFWTEAEGNRLADRGQFDSITKRINGGMNGAESRRHYYQAALNVFSI